MNSRHEAILEILSADDEVSVAHLAKELRVSMVTIRSDLRYLENQNLITRNHGGARLPDSDDIGRRMSIHFSEKQRIAAAAAEEVEENETVLLESGSSVALMAHLLSRRRNINVITNNAYVARQLKPSSDTKVFLLGGVYQKESETMVGPFVSEYLSQFNFSKVFLGMDGFVMDQGPMCRDVDRAEVIREFVNRDVQVYVISDSTKMGNIAIRTICKPERIDCLITDDGIDPEYKAYFENSATRLVLV